MLEATIFSYFAMNNIQDDIVAQQAGIVNYRAPSYGKFSTSLTTSYWFGTPRNVSASGLSMDVDKVSSTTVDKNNNAQAWVNFNQMIGNRYSAMEHLVPEQMFSTEEAPAEGISAVKAIALAGEAGQKIWTITQGNLDVALASINLDRDTENEIRNSVNAGKVVTTHEQSINFNGWVGEGYIILDPQTGAGAYKIAGGGNGAVVPLTQAIFSSSFSLLGLLVDYKEALLKKENPLKAVLRLLGKVVGTAGVIIESIFTIFDLYEKCGGFASIGFWLMVSFSVVSILGFAYVSIISGGSAAVLFNSVLKSVLSLVKDFALNIVSSDVGCK
jgi:uncharacterized membrane protein YjfL (UPF0719 family)